MRFEHLAVRTGDEELGMAFHERLTIVSGLGHAERREMVELLLNSLVGGRREASLLRYVDGTGRVVLVEADEGRVRFTYEDGSPAADPLAPLGLDLAALRRISHVKGTDMDRLAASAGGHVPPELEEARRTLAELTEELDAADDAQHELEAFRFELADVDEQLRDVTAGAPRRQFARLVLQLQQVRAEAALTGEQAGLGAADAEQLAAAPEVRRLAARWEAAAAKAGEVRARFGDRTRMEADDLARGLALPDRMPVELVSLAAELDRVEAVRAELEAQLPAPSTKKQRKAVASGRAGPGPGRSGHVVAGRQSRRERGSAGQRRLAGAGRARCRRHHPDARAGSSTTPMTSSSGPTRRCGEARLSPAGPRSLPRRWPWRASSCWSRGGVPPSPASRWYRCSPCSRLPGRARQWRGCRPSLAVG